MSEPTVRAADTRDMTADVSTPDHTVTAPAHPVPFSAPAGRRPAVGDTVGDFRLVKVLGAGAFGTVFLAHQQSLDRMVALKATAGADGSRAEGLALAGLEHDHIVKVYSGFADPAGGWHYLCLQYVPGTNLAAVIKELHRPGGPPPACGRDVLAAIDRQATGESRFDPGALRDREGLDDDDFAQAVCRLGSRLAQALAFAHARGVLHCDVKPANVLVTPYGRPMLADFNVAFDRGRRQPGDSGLGGTLAYMAPEHLRAMTGEGGATVDERCDVYSLGVVLCELATGVRPKRPTEPGGRGSGGAGILACPVGPGAGKNACPTDQVFCAAVPRELAAVVRRCLAFDPAARYQTAGDLADALGAAWSLLAARRNQPPPDRMSRAILRRPFRALVFFALVPHLLASALNIGYNSAEVTLAPAQQAAFVWVVLGYNAVAYPAAVVTGYLLLRGVYRGCTSLPTADGPAADELRARVLRLGGWAVVMSAAGWFPGGVLFPLGIHALAGPLPWQVFAHYFVSFTLSGLVGMVFSHLGVMGVVMRAFYPRCGNPDRFTPALARDEVTRASRLFGPFLLLASAVPLTGAVLLVAVADEHLTLAVRLLLVGLIGLGMSGVSLAARMTDRLRKLTAVWTAAPAGP